MSLYNVGASDELFLTDERTQMIVHMEFLSANEYGTFPSNTVSEIILYNVLYIDL